MVSGALAETRRDSERRPRPFGAGRLFAWQTHQPAALPRTPAGAHGATDRDLTKDGLDPVVTQREPERFDVAFPPLARFEVDFVQKTVTLVDYHARVDQNTIDHLLDDHIAPRIIAAQGPLVLHASANLVSDRLAVFLGQTGSGKSTLAASLHVAGHRLLGDDAVVVSGLAGTPEGEVVHPSLRLYRESIDEVFTGEVRTGAMAFYSDKLHVAALAPEEADAVAEPVRFPLGAIFVLGEDHGDGRVILDRLSPADACMALVENAFAFDAHAPAGAAGRMAQAARLAAAVPCYELSYPYDFALLGEVGARVTAVVARLADAA